MSKFLPLQEFKTVFDGEEVLFVLKPILLHHTMLFQNLVSSLEPGDVKEASMTKEEILEYVKSLSTEERLQRLEREGKRTLEVIKIFQEILPDYIERMSLKDANGGQISVQTFCSVSYFKDLVVEVGSALVNAGSPANPKHAG